MHSSYPLRARSRGLRALCLFLCAVLALAAPAGAEGAEASDRYQYGLLNALFMSDDHGETAMRVLYDPEADVLYLNPNSMLGKLSDYECTFQTGGFTMRVAGREYVFTADTAVTTLRLGDVECFYMLKKPVLRVNGEYWVPADDYLYLLNIKAIPLAADGDETSWTPNRDLTVFCDPAWTVQAVLKEIFAVDNGARWMFNYQDDLGLTASQIQWKVGEATAATGVYSLLKIDMTAILRLCAESITGLANSLAELSEDLFGVEFMRYASAYEKAYFRRFVEAMVTPSTFQREAIAGDLGDNLSFVGLIMNGFSNDSDAAPSEKECAYLSGKLSEGLDVDSQVVQDVSEGGVDLDDMVGKGLTLLQFGIAIGRAMDRMTNEDDLTLAAIQRFLDASTDTHKMDEVSRVSFEDGYNSVKMAVKGLSEDMTSAMIDIILPAVLEELKVPYAEELSGAGEHFGLAWNQVENFLKDVIPSQNALEMMQMSLYGIYYERDALQTLKTCYDKGVVAKDFTDAQQLEQAGMLALNYLKACLVTTECALVVYERDKNVNETTAYAALKTKARRQSQLIWRLTCALTAMRRGNEYRGLGVPFHSGGTPKLNAPDYGLLPLVQFTPMVIFAYDPFTAQAGQVTMLMLEGEHLFHEANEGYEPWVRLTDAETGFRPGPVSGGVSTRVRVTSLPGGQLLTEWDVASGVGAAGAQSRYAVYDVQLGQGFRAVLTGMSAVAGGKLTACELNGEACDGPALEAAFLEKGIEFAQAILPVGKGGQVAGQLAYFSAEPQDGAVILEISSEAPRPLLPLFEELLEAYGVGTN